MAQKALYEERYCAFVDILGFRELVDSLDDDAERLQSLRDLIFKVHNPPPTNVTHLQRTDFRAQSISDAVAISAAVTAAGLGAIVHSINQLAVDLLIQGFFIRGALVRDRLYHDEKTVFGKALVRVYTLESSVARYPRVMIAREVLGDMRNTHQQTAVRLARRSDDGPMFVHVLRAIEMAALPFDLGSEETKGLPIDHPKFGDKLIPYAGIADQLQRRFDEATDNPNHFEKAKWFANYWNETIKEWGLRGFERVTGPGLDPKPAVWGD